MTTQPLQSASAPSALARNAGVAVAGIAGALILGLAAGHPTPDALILAGGLLALTTVFLAFRFPFAGFLLLSASTILLMVVAVTRSRGVNPFDLVLAPVFVASFLGRARFEARAADAAESRPGVLRVMRSLGKLEKAAFIFFGLALASLVPGVLSGHASNSFDSALVLFRGLQGLALFPLCLWWLRTERGIRRVTQALMTGAIAFSIFNSVAIALWGTRRAGLTWVLNDSDVPGNSPNEAATGLLLVSAVVLALQAVKPRLTHVLILAVSVVMLVMTQSRSGLLAWLVFFLMSLRWSHAKWVLIALALGLLAMPLVPDVYWQRIARTAILERGSFEAYSSLVRVFGWGAAWQMFLDHPIFGVGYLGFRFLSHQYNEFQLVLATTESYYLETATGMGLIGLAALGLLIVRLYQVGQTVRREASPGTLGHELARYHAPLLTGLLVANLTGDNFIGLLGLGQFALWTGLLAQAGKIGAAGKPD